MSNKLFKASMFAVFVSAVLSVGTLLADGKYAAIEWSKILHDFGTIEKNKSVRVVFKFSNSGKVPLILQSAEGSCGCTGVKYSSEPIAPGASAELTATFDAAKEGLFHKTVTVKANTQKGNHILQIKGKVVPSSAP